MTDASQRHVCENQGAGRVRGPHEDERATLLRGSRQALLERLVPQEHVVLGRTFVEGGLDRVREQQKPGAHVGPRGIEPAW